MKLQSLIRTAVAFALIVLATLPAPARAAVSEQVITLQPGWNAIYLELQPEQRDIATVFAGLPVASVWRWRPDTSGAQFVRDPGEGLENIEGWFAWFPQPRPDAFLTNLYQIEGGTAYLVRLEGSQSRQITITGRPLFRPRIWQADAFSLTGLPIDPGNAPSFAEYFARSPAHAGQPVYTLESDGRWRLVTSPASEVILPGRAYWVFTRGNSNYQGPMQVVLDQGESLEFSAALQEMTVVLRNYSGATGSFQIQRVGGDTLPLLYRLEDEETGEVSWPVLRDSLILDAPANSDIFLTLAVDRSRFEASRMEQVLSVRDEQGTRVLLFAGGNTIQPFIPAAAKGGVAKAVGDGYAGLWVGEIEIDKVSEAQQAGTTPTPTLRTFVQRVLVHVDNAGQARLLKDVIQMWQDGTTVPSAQDPTLNEVDQPGRYVLLTNKDLIGLYSGASTRDGTPVGIRYSTVGYDFDGEALELEGDFGGDRTLQAAVVVEPDLPTNPFLHKYHPDHNNLDEQFLNYREEAFRVVRDMQFVFSPTPPGGIAVPGWGDSRVGGTFEEAIVGLHRNPIFVSGRFELRRVSAVAVLNQ
jgi:hypothetical protein